MKTYLTFRLFLLLLIPATAIELALNVQSSGCVVINDTSYTPKSSASSAFKSSSSIEYFKIDDEY